MSERIPPQKIMLQMLSGYWISQCIYAAAKLGIADLLQDGEKHSDVLANATNTNKNAIYRLLRALASVGIFAETRPRYFKLTALGACLQSDVPESIRAFSITLGDEVYYAWGNLMYSLRTGKNAFENLHNLNFFEFYEKNPTKAKNFDRAMTELSRAQNGSILDVYDFSSVNKLVDVGGGNGLLLSSILQAYSNMTGVLFERSDVIDRAEDLLKKNGLRKRIELVKGDFFKNVPVGGDAYLLKHIIHNWSDGEAVSILKNCYEAMGEQDRLLVIDMVIHAGNEPFEGKFMDINMLILCPGGRERTEVEYEKLFKIAGFKITKIFPTESELSIIEGVKEQK